MASHPTREPSNGEDIQFTLAHSTTDPRPHNTTAPKACPPTFLTDHQLSVYRSNVGIMTIIFALALFGNLCVLLAVWRRRAKRTRMHYFIVHLAIADLVVALFQVLPHVLEMVLCGFFGTDAACRLIRYLSVLGMYGSTYVLVCTAMDRYLAIRYPMQTFKLSKRRVHMAIGMAWLLSMVLSTPQLFFFHLDSHLPWCRMIEVNHVTKGIYVTWYIFSVMVLPGAMLTFFYGMIAAIIYKNLRQKRQAASANRAFLRPDGSANTDFAPRASNVKIVSKAKIKTVKMTLVIVILFILCYAPYFTVQFLATWGFINAEGAVSTVLHQLANLNSCVNPWVYMGFSGHLLGELKQAIMCWTKTGQKPPPLSFRSTMITNTGNSVMFAESSNMGATQAPTSASGGDKDSP